MKPHEYVILEISRERERQIGEEGWTTEHDDKHDSFQMARAAACYALNAACSDAAREVISYEANRLEEPSITFIRRYWPWARAWWKPKDRRRDLVRAAALLVAELERHDRAAASAQGAQARATEPNS